MAKTTNPEADRFNLKYECFITNGAAFLLGVIATVVVIFVLARFPSSELGVRPINKTGSDLEYVELVFDEYSVRIPGEKIGVTSPSAHFRIHVGDHAEYVVRAKPVEGAFVVSDVRSVDPGCAVIETVFADRIEHMIRACH